MGQPWWAGLLVASQLCLPCAAWAQEAQLAQEAVPSPTPVLVLDWERLFSNARLGQYVLEGIEEQRVGLAAENNRIQEELTAEELELAERRPSLDTEEFQALADDFDQKVQRIRADQDAKELALQRRVVVARQRFQREVEGSLIAEIMRERGAVLVLDSSTARIFSNDIDITEEAMVRLGDFLDTTLGQEDGSDNTHAVKPAAE